MKKIAIFDFNRTLYDPENNTLTSGALETLTSLQLADVTMGLISRKEPGREGIAVLKSIQPFLEAKRFVADKDAGTFRELALELGEANDSVYVIGDHLHDEIRYGNQCGYQTILVKAGKFNVLKPETETDIPWRTVKKIKEIVPIILDS